jgi:hypothetical protein
VTVTIDPQFRAALHPEATVVFRVLADAPLTEALQGVRQDLMAINGRFANRDGDPLGPKLATAPIPVPGGQLMMVDFGDSPPQALAAVPDLIANRLTGFGDATVDLPPRMGDRYSVIHALAPAARAFLSVPFRGGPPDALLAAALDWIRAQQPPDAELTALVISAEIPVTWETAAGVCRAVLAADSNVRVLATDFGTGMAQATLSGGLLGAAPRVALTEAGTTRPVADAMRAQRELIRAHAGALGWAVVTPEIDAAWADLANWAERPAGARPRRFWELAADQLVPDGCWYQLLSAGHLARLGTPPPGSVPLPDGRVELTVGEPEQWLPGHPDRPAVRARAQELLAGCLADEESGFAVTRQRLAALRGGPGAPPAHRAHPA